MNRSRDETGRILASLACLLVASAALGGGCTATSDTDEIGTAEEALTLPATGADPLHPDLPGALPRGTPEDAHLFDLLRRGYIDARYVKSYRITAEELVAIGELVRAFAVVVGRICREKIAALRVDAEAG